MLPNDVLRGCLWATGTGGAAHAAFFVVLSISESPATAFWMSFVTLLVAGVVAVPFATIAFVAHMVLSKRGQHIAFWVPSATITCIGFAFIGTVNLPDIAAITLYCAGVGALTGLTFWYVAVGMTWSALPIAAQIQDPAFRNKAMT